LVTQTYFSLLDAVGKGAITPEYLDAVRLGGDPFALPKRDLPNASIQKRVNDFEEILKRHSGPEGVTRWKAVLLKALVQRVATKRKSANLRDEAIELTGRNVTWLEDNRMEGVAPNFVGNWVVGFSNRLEGKGKSRKSVSQIFFKGVDGRIAEATIDSPVPLFKEDEPPVTHFLPSGKFYVATPSGKPPLLEGTLFDEAGNPAKEITLTPTAFTGPKESRQITNIQGSPDGKKLMVLSGSEAWAGALPKSVKKPIALRKVSREVYDLADTDFFQFLGNDHVAVVSEGTLKLIPVRAGKAVSVESDFGFLSVGLAAGGKKVLVHLDKEFGRPPIVTAVDLKTGKRDFKVDMPLPTMVWEVPNSNPKKTELIYPNSIMVTPDGKYLVAILDGHFNLENREVVMMDAKNGEILFRKKYESFPPVDEWSFSADGKRLVGRRDWEGETSLVVLNYRGLVDQK